MDAVAFCPRPFSDFPPPCSFTKQHKLGRPYLCSLNDRSSNFASRKNALPFTLLSTSSDESRRSRPPQRSSAQLRAKNENESENYRSPSSSSSSSSSSSRLPKSANKEEIIALFRRIQSSISKGAPTSTTRSNADLLEEKSPAESVLEVLRQSRKQEKDMTGFRKRDGRFTQKRRFSKKQKSQNEAPESAENFKLTRLPSNFVRRSPIPFLSGPRGKASELDNEASSPTTGSKETQLPVLEKMKVAELKELAKSKGIKGYSKLKKSELLELLRS